MTVPPELHQSRDYAMRHDREQEDVNKLVRLVATTEAEAQSPRFWHAVTRARKELGIHATPTELYARVSKILPTML